MATEQDIVVNDENYWVSRKDYQYYQVAARLAKEYAPTARTVPRCQGTRHAVLWKRLTGSLPKRRSTSIALPLFGRETSGATFLNFEPNTRFDLVFCLQVLEHLRRPAAFLKRLLAIGKLVIVSVPYQWAHNPDSDHVHDAVDEARLILWAGKRWVHAAVVEDQSRERLIAVFRECDPATSGTALELGDSDVEIEWATTLVKEIESVSICRRKPRYVETVWATLSSDDPLRNEVAGSFAAVWSPRGFWRQFRLDERRSCSGGSSTSFVQAAIFNLFIRAGIPEAAGGVYSLLRRAA